MSDPLSYLDCAAQVPLVADIQPRAVPLSRSRLWVLGTGFAAVTDRVLSCSFTHTTADGRIVQLNVSGAVFSNFRAICWTADYPGLTTAELQDRAGLYTVLFTVDGQVAAATAPLQVVFQLPCTDPAACASFCAQGSVCFPTLTSIFPLSGPSTGGSAVRVYGLGFDSAVATDVRCKFGDASTDGWSSATIVNQTLLRCVSVPSSAGLDPQLTGTVPLRVTLNGQDYSPPFPYVYYVTPILSHVSAPLSMVPDAWTKRLGIPYGALKSGGTVINVHGFFFPETVVAVGDTLCDFGFAQSRAESVLPTVLSCTAPACGASSPNCSAADRWVTTVDILLNGQDRAEQAPQLVFYSPPVVLGMFPVGGPEEFEAVVRVRGTGFGRFGWYPRCRFGMVQRDAWVVNDTDVLCRSPPSNLSACCASGGCSSCLVDFSYLANAQNAVANPAVSFNLYQRPSLLGIEPRGAPRTRINGTDLLTTVTLTGIGFRFAVAQTYIRFVPNISAVLSQVTVSSDFYSDFVYLSYPLEWSLPAILAVSNSPQSRVDSAVCKTPSYGFDGLTLVDITLNRQDFLSTGRVTFEFYDQPTLEALSPQSGPVDGGTEVTVYGRGLANFGEKVLCRFSSLPGASGAPWISSTPAKVRDGGLLRCTAPAGPSAGPVMIEVTLNGNDYSDPISPFIYYLQPEVSDVQPAGGPTVGGTLVSLLFMQQLARAEDLEHLNTTCSFSGVVTAATVQKDDKHNMLVCVAPAHAAQMVPLSVSLNGNDYGSTSFYTYYLIPALSSSIPTGAVPYRLEEGSSAIVTVMGSGFAGFSERPLCRFGCYTSPATTITDSQIECTAPWPSNRWDLFLPLCASNEHEQSCTYSQCPSTGCALKQYSSSETIKCILDVWLEVSLNGFDFSVDSKLNFRFYQALSGLDFRPSGGPVDGQTTVEFFFIDGLGGFQRLNDGTFAANFGGSKVICETVATEEILVDDFDIAFGSQSSSSSGADYIYDTRYWVDESGIKSTNACGSMSYRGLWFADIVGGNVQGFGARLASKNSSSNALTFTGPSAGGWSGRYALTKPLDLSRGFKISFALGHGYSEWPDPCDKPEEPDVLELMRKPVLYYPAAVPPKYRERKYWDIISTWATSDTGPSESLSTINLEVRAQRIPLGASSSLDDMIICAHNAPCNSSFAQLIFFQGSHGQGPFDVWVIDDIFVYSYGGIANDTSAVCKTPPQISSELVEVNVSLNGQQFHTATSRFQYYKQPKLSNIDPSGGQLAGGTVTTITGSGFLAYRDARYPAKCKFAVTIVDALVLNNKTMLCVSPGSEEMGYVKVAVALNGVDFTSDTTAWIGMSFIYYSDPQLSGIYPDSGPATGRTSVNILGQGFITLIPKQPYCKFSPVHDPNSYQVVPANYLNNTLITCITPNMTYEFSDDESAIQTVVEISLNGQEYTNSESLYFTFYQQVHITAAEQNEPGNNLVLNGGDPVTVHGKRLRYDSEARYVFKVFLAAILFTSHTHWLFFVLTVASTKPKMCVQKRIAQMERTSAFCTCDQIWFSVMHRIFLAKRQDTGQDLQLCICLQTESIFP